MDKLKTNAMRILDKENINYEILTYDANDGMIDGISVAGKMGLPVESVYKTLVTQGHTRNYYVFIIPVAEELNLKAAARSVGEKSVEMIKAADINKVTGYIRGGCSPIGMKKNFTTVLDNSSDKMNFIIISAGKIGHQIKIAPSELVSLIKCKTDGIIVNK